MKSIKSLLLIAAAMFTTASYAQVDKTFSFVDKDGKEIPSGTVWTANHVEEDDFGAVQVPSEVFVRNNTNEKKGVGTLFDLKRLDNGSFQTCFPASCIPATNKLGKGRTEGGPMNPNQTKSLKTEWFPEADGTCEATIKLEYYNIDIQKVGIMTKEVYELVDEEDLEFPMPYITIIFTKGATAINGIKDGENVEVTGIYDATGKQIQTTQKGLNIVKLSNGKTVKIVK